MAFILINKIVVIVLIIALIIYLFRKKGKPDSVFVLSIIFLFVWSINIIVDGYFWINFVNLSLVEVGFLPQLELWSRYVMYILLAIISVALMVRVYKKENEKARVEEKQHENNKEGNY